MLGEINTKGLDFYLRPKEEKHYKEGLEVLRQYDQYIHYPFLQIVRFSPPSKWGRSFAKRLLAVNKMQNLDICIKEFLKCYGIYIWDALRTPIQEGSIPRTAMYNVHEIDKYLPTEQKGEIEVNFMPFEEILSRFHNRITVIKKEHYKKLIFVANNHIVKIPLVKNVYHKGGVSRLLLKKIFNEDLIASEVPIKDWDIIVPDSMVGDKFLKVVREKDLSGVETVHSLYSDKKTALKRIMYGRDTTVNLVLIGYDGMYYCNEAKQAVISGIIDPCSGDHGLYGRDYITLTDEQGQKHEIVKGRVFERLIKMVVEKKSTAFRIKKENLQINIGPALLMGISRNIGKQDMFCRMHRFFTLLDKMGQIEQFKYVVSKKFGIECKNIYDILDGVHAIFPFIKIDKKGQEAGVAKWLITKLIIWFRENFKYKYHFSEIDMSWFIFDYSQEKEIFDLQNFQTDQQYLNFLENGFESFLKRCSQRNHQYNPADS